MQTIQSAVDEMLADLERGPLVYRDASGYVLTDRDQPGFTYDIADFQCEDAGSALRWVAHMAQKSWITTRHLEQFARLAAERFGGRFP